MHLAPAIEPKRGLKARRPCVVIAGGREPPHWEAYPTHAFLHTVGTLACCLTGGCWRSRTRALGDGDETADPFCSTYSIGAHWNGTPLVESLQDIMQRQMNGGTQRNTWKTVEVPSQKKEAPSSTRASLGKGSWPRTRYLKTAKPRVPLDPRAAMLGGPSRVGHFSCPACRTLERKK